MRAVAILCLLPTLALAEDILVDPLSATTNWALTGQRVCYTLGKSGLAAVKEPAREGAQGSVKLTYDFDRRWWVGMQWRGEPLVGRVDKLTFWVHGDASKHQLAARIQDANDRGFEVRLGALDWEGWRQITLPMDETKWSAVRRYAEEALPARWPVTLREIRLQRANQQTLLGSVAFSELCAESRVRPLDRVRIAVATDAAVNTFYLPEPVKLGATFKNPTTTALDGRIETVVSDWLGREQRFDGGALTLAAGATVERELRLPMTALGAFQAWVRFQVGDAVREGSKRFAISRKPTSPPPQDPNSPFGMGLYLPRFRTDAELTQAIALAREAGVKWTRDGIPVAQVASNPARWAWEGPRWIAGREGGAVEFSAGRGFTVQDSPALNRPCATGEVTFSFWIKFSTFDYSDRWRVLLSKGEGPQRQFFLFLTVPTRQLAVSFGDGANSWSDIACQKADWKIGQWHHVVMAHRRADKSVRWWVDGAPSGNSEARFDNTLNANDLPLEIGRTLDYGLDDFAIHDRALTPAELKTAKPVARWLFDEGKGDRAADASGNGNHAEVKPLRQDLIFEQTAAAGISTYAILMGVPKWMASKPTEGMDRPWMVMPKLDEWSRAVEAIVARYKERGIHVWEIWNEPNIEPFWSPKPDASEYYQVLAASYAAIKKADPQATVLGCALAGPHGLTHRPPYEFVEEVLKLDGGKVMDAISIHPYRQPRSPEESDYLGDLQAISDLTAKYGRQLPVWITEVGWPNDTGGVSEVWATKMLPRAYLLALAAGVKNIAWYDYHDDGQDPSYLEHNCGLLLYDLTPKPAYFAYRTMATELAGMKFEREAPAGPGATVLVFAAGERRTAVAWSHRKDTALALRVGDMKEIDRPKGAMARTGKVEFRLASTHAALLAAARKGGPVPGYYVHWLKKKRGYRGSLENETWYLVSDHVEMTGERLRRLFPDQKGTEPVIGFEFDEAGSEAFASVTERNIGAPLAIIIDDELVWSPIIRERIPGRGIIEGNFTQEQANEIVTAWRAASLQTEIELVELMGNVERRPVRDGALMLTLGEDAVFLRDVPASLAAVRPVACAPSVLKLLRGDTGQLQVTLHNPFSKPLALRATGQSVDLAPGEQRTVTLSIRGEEAAAWKPPVWRSLDGQMEWPTPARVVALAGQREPIFQRAEEVKEPITVPDSSALTATDEVTVACWLRADGPSDTWQSPVAKWVGDVQRNYGLYLGREKGELCFSASFEKGTFRHNDFNSGVSLFDGKWHHVAATYSKHDAEVCLYVDGKQVKRQAFDGGDLKPTQAPVTILTGFALAKDGQTTQQGAVRDVRLWSRALTPEEICGVRSKH